MTGCPRAGRVCTGLLSIGGALMVGPATMHRPWPRKECHRYGVGSHQGCDRGCYIMLLSEITHGPTCCSLLNKFYWAGQTGVLVVAE
ncbi:hypothetical protein HaLaN_00696 [Haematococcus lacustris]|uniref:Uncharacterized protein n=1 Tax=Haematococcus lacustris TaxID=44745 RepID=A0A699YJK3_HAELA|nr:hypothetical protein HaLaN_00696 [Haematococcus lacustris]